VAWRTYHHAVAGVTVSEALSDTPKSAGADQNILLMGLDSRLDEHGRPLPQDMYDALHAGDDSVGGHNANVLILLHIPGDGSQSTAISIPRDDYTTLDPAACGTATASKGKIKQAYGYAYARARQMLAATVHDPIELEQQARDAGRRAEIGTVRSFLGGVPIDHFVEVTLVAFFQVAEAVQPITVCLNENTSDPYYSGADFRKGPQQIDAGQAMAFVRQRRDPHPSLEFTDLDRTRRQQAFIVSVARQLRSSGALASPGTLVNLLDIAQQNIAVDHGLDPVQFAGKASDLMDGGLALYTLPIKGFATTDAGESINLVDTAQIHAIAHRLLTPAQPGAPTTTPTATAIPGAADVIVYAVNASGRPGVAARAEQVLAAQGFRSGEISPRPVSATALGTAAPLPTDLSTMDSGSIPCVK
jgi:LCP family protein required for cell wall assembly